MSTQQAYINGFVKRASEYGLDQNQAVELLKQAGPISTGTGAAVSTGTAVAAPHINETGAALSTPAKGPTRKPFTGGYENMTPEIKKNLGLPMKAGEEVPYTGVKNIGDYWNEFKTKMTTMINKTPVSKGTPKINPLLETK